MCLPKARLIAANHSGNFGVAKSQQTAAARCEPKFWSQRSRVFRPYTAFAAGTAFLCRSHRTPACVRPGFSGYPASPNRARRYSASQPSAPARARSATAIESGIGRQPHTRECSSCQSMRWGSEGSFGIRCARCQSALSRGKLSLCPTSFVLPMRHSACTADESMATRPAPPPAARSPANPH